MSADQGHPDRQYLALLADILDNGDRRMDRTGVGTLAVFGRQMRFDLSRGFPLLTTKRINWKSAFKEILWMLDGGTNIRELLEQNVRIWSEWPHKRYCEATGEAISVREFEQRILDDEEFAARWGSLGPVYGKQWRRWRTSDGREIDQVQQVVDMLKNNPSSRRILWDGWNVGELDQMALPPCHKHYQFFVEHATGRLCGAMVQRSVDVGLGCPWNWAALALVTTLLAEQAGYTPGEIVWFGMDTHVYLNQVEQLRGQLSREPREIPRLTINRRPASLFDYRIEDFDIEGYDPHPAIKMAVAV